MGMVVGACTCVRRSAATRTGARCPTSRWRRTSATPRPACRALRSSIASGVPIRSIARRWRGWCARSVASLTRPTRPPRAPAAAARSGCWTRGRWARAGWLTGCGSASGSARRSSLRPGGRRRGAGAVERRFFAMVANRLSVKPLSKLAGCGWVAERAFVEGLAEVSDDACYRAMDFLHAVLPALQELLFFDTTSTYWETDRLPDELIEEDDEDDGDDGDQPGGPGVRERGLRKYS